MKLQGYENIKLFIESIIDFLGREGIKPVNMPAEDYTVLNRTILESEFSRYSCQPGIGYYSIGFRTAPGVSSEGVYMYCFINKISGRSWSIIIEINPNSTVLDSFLSLSWDEPEVPPLMSDFADDQYSIVTEGPGGCSRTVLGSGGFMTADNFRGFVNDSRPWKVNVVVVDD